MVRYIRIIDQFMYKPSYSHINRGIWGERSPGGLKC